MQFVTNPRLSQWLLDGDFDSVAAYVFGRYGVEIEAAEIERIYFEYARWWRGMYKKPVPALTDADMWLKLRLRFDVGPGSAIDRQTYNELHLFPIHWEQVDCKVTDDDVHLLRRQLRRLAEARSPVGFLGERLAQPIDRTAAKVVPDTSQACPWCREWFRNPVAMSLHASERHGQRVVVTNERFRGAITQ